MINTPLLFDDTLYAPAITLPTRKSTFLDESLPTGPLVETTPPTFLVAPDQNPLPQEAVEPLSGRGLWYGATHYTEFEWALLMKQAASWEIQLVHPKVAQGNRVWYDENGLKMLKKIALEHGVTCIPYHSVNGNLYGALEQEAALLSYLGLLFGAVIPEMMAEWKDQQRWMHDLGNLIRHKYDYHGPIYPTTGAAVNAIPLVEMNEWMTAWMPQVYFSEWTLTTAMDAINFIGPQWVSANTECKTAHNRPLAPILPIISLTKGISVVEVVSWIIQTRHFGYCGFWNNLGYPPYADAIKHTPRPFLKKEVVVPPLAPLVSPIADPTSIIVASTGEAEMQMPLSEEEAATDQAKKPRFTLEQLQVIWHSKVETIPWNPEAALCSAWITAYQRWPELFIGPPVSAEYLKEIDGVKVVMMDCSSGRTLYHYQAAGITRLG